MVEVGLRGEPPGVEGLEGGDEVEGGLPVAQQLRLDLDERGRRPAQHAHRHAHPRHRGQLARHQPERHRRALHGQEDGRILQEDMAIWLVGKQAPMYSVFIASA